MAVNMSKTIYMMKNVQDFCKRSFIFASLCLNQIERTPLGETKTPCLRGSLLARN